MTTLDIKLTTRFQMVDLDHLSVDDVNIGDIAHSLSQQCRFNGQTWRFYSVAEHAPYVARLTKLYILNHEAPYIEQWSESDKAMCCLGALCHDNPEAFTGDIVRPVKRHISHFKEIEEAIEPVMEAAFGLRLTEEMHTLIKRADDTLADLETRYFFPWKVIGKPPSEHRLTDFAGPKGPGLSPRKAKKFFLETFRKAMAGNWKEI